MWCVTKKQAQCLDFDPGNWIHGGASYSWHWEDGARDSLGGRGIKGSAEMLKFETF